MDERIQSRARSFQLRVMARQLWVLGLIARELEGTASLSPDPSIDYAHVDEGALGLRERKILQLYREGLNYCEIARRLTEGNVPTKKGGTWRHRTVQLVLERILRLHPPLIHSGRS